MLARGLAQARLRMWWTSSLFAYSVFPHEPRKTLLLEYQSQFSEWLSRPRFAFCECYYLALSESFTHRLVFPECVLPCSAN